MSKWIKSAVENDIAAQTEKPVSRLASAGQSQRSDAEELGDTTSTTTGLVIPGFWRKVLFAAWLAVLLGVVIEGILLAVLAGLGETRSSRSIVAGMVQKVSWSTIVCAGLAIGTTASKLRAPLMGLAGLFSAPLAFIVAKSLHQSAAQALSLAAAAAGGPSPVVLALIKGIEYLVLGTILGWISKRHELRAILYMATGLTVGVVFGSGILAITYRTLSQTIHTSQLISMGINELLFPFGCSLVLFTAGMMGKGGAATTVAQPATKRPGAMSGPIVRGTGDLGGRTAAPIG